MLLFNLLNTERMVIRMRSELAILAIWLAIYMAVMMVAMLTTAVGFHIFR